MNQTELEVHGMTCAMCVRHVESALRQVPNVRDVQVSLAEKKATVRYEGDLDLPALIRAVEEEGYEARAPQGS